MKDALVVIGCLGRRRLGRHHTNIFRAVCVRGDLFHPVHSCSDKVDFQNVLGIAPRHPSGFGRDLPPRGS